MKKSFQFPPWTNKIRHLAAVAVACGSIYITLVVTFGFSPNLHNVGYKPSQPIPFSHKLHAGDMGMDCRYCHQTVEVADHAAVPATQTCMNCHTRVFADSEKLDPLNDSWKNGTPVQWVRVHDLPDYVFFSHSSHVQQGVGCASCHGRVDQMDVVSQREPLSMGWCLDCHRDPADHIRPRSEVTKMDWKLADNGDRDMMAENKIHPKEGCSTCHR